MQQIMMVGEVGRCDIIKLRGLLSLFLWCKIRLLSPVDTVGIICLRGSGSVGVRLLDFDWSIGDLLTNQNLN